MEAGASLPCSSPPDMFSWSGGIFSIVSRGTWTGGGFVSGNTSLWKFGKNLSTRFQVSSQISELSEFSDGGVK